MSHTANIYLEKTISRFRKVLSPAVIPISLPKDIKSPPNTKRPHPFGYYNPPAPPECRGLKYLSTKGTKQTPKLHEVPKLTNSNADPQKNKQDFQYIKFTTYPCEPTGGPWRECSADCPYSRRRQQRQYNCHCSDCRHENCPGRYRGAGGQQAPSCQAGHADIATYVDTSTMTGYEYAGASTSVAYSTPPAASPDPPSSPEVRDDLRRYQRCENLNSCGKNTCPSAALYENDSQMSAHNPVTYVEAKCPTCMQTVRAPLVDTQCNFELTPMHRKACYSGIPTVSPRVGPVAMTSASYPPRCGPRSMSCEKYPALPPGNYYRRRSANIECPSDCPLVFGPKQVRNRSLSPRRTTVSPKPQIHNYEWGGRRPSRYHNDCTRTHSSRATTPSPRQTPPRPRRRPLASSQCPGRPRCGGGAPDM